MESIVSGSLSCTPTGIGSGNCGPGSLSRWGATSPPGNSTGSILLRCCQSCVRGGWCSVTHTGSSLVLCQAGQHCSTCKQSVVRLCVSWCGMCMLRQAVTDVDAKPALGGVSAAPSAGSAQQRAELHALLWLPACFLQRQACCSTPTGSKMRMLW